jgi:hypothetical protein
MELCPKNSIPKIARFEVAREYLFRTVSQMSVWPRMSEAEFSLRYGASPEDIEKVRAFVDGRGLEVLEIHSARRTIMVRGNVAKMNAAQSVVASTACKHFIVHRFPPRPIASFARNRSEKSSLIGNRSWCAPSGRDLIHSISDVSEGRCRALMVAARHTAST